MVALPENQVTCPLRMNDMGPWERAEGLDHWDTDRWAHLSWIWIPRTCSFCGGVHPADTIKLLSEGWRIDPSTKSYKGYLEMPDGRQLTPPAKFYTLHFTAEEIGQLNTHLISTK